MAYLIGRRDVLDARLLLYFILFSEQHVFSELPTVDIRSFADPGVRSWPADSVLGQPAHLPTLEPYQASEFRSVLRKEASGVTLCGACITCVGLRMVSRQS